jgi:hypothetical protein
MVNTDWVAANNHKCAGKYKCDKCNFTTNQGEEMKILFKFTRYSRFFFFQRLKTAYQLPIHEKQHLQEDKEVYKCVVCKKQYQFKIELIAHQAIHKQIEKVSTNLRCKKI